jgi:hypothetical protein
MDVHAGGGELTGVQLISRLALAFFLDITPPLLIKITYCYTKCNISNSIGNILHFCFAPAGCILVVEKS